MSKEIVKIDSRKAKEGKFNSLKVLLVIMLILFLLNTLSSFLLLFNS